MIGIAEVSLWQCVRIQIGTTDHEHQVRPPASFAAAVSIVIAALTCYEAIQQDREDSAVDKSVQLQFDRETPQSLACRAPHGIRKPKR